MLYNCKYRHVNSHASRVRFTHFLHVHAFGPVPYASWHSMDVLHDCVHLSVGKPATRLFNGERRNGNKYDIDVLSDSSLEIFLCTSVILMGVVK